jgi:uncharacterized protein (TIGR00255 family)
VLLSMTGFGNATQQSESAYISVELKAVNNRYLKISMRLPDMVTRYESDVEKLIRDAIARGSVQLNVRVRLNSVSSGYAINTDILNHYLGQLNAIKSGLHLTNNTEPSLSDLLQLPGVVSESDVSPDVVDSIWPSLKSTLNEALVHFDDFRQTEGESMLQDLKLQCKVIEEQVDAVAKNAPTVVAEYREKLLDRVRKAVEEAEVSIDQKDVIRDVAMFADRCDINEEFHRFLDSDKSMGRKLEFVGQEMFREINTIGSKANNVTIAHSVVEMKAAIERIREVLQNVE